MRGHCSSPCSASTCCRAAARCGPRSWSGRSGCSAWPRSRPARPWPGRPARAGSARREVRAAGPLGTGGRRGRTCWSEGARRIYSFGRAARSWDGRWLLLLASVPDSKRELRHRLRTQLAWAGFGALAAGVWVSPDPGREAEARSILAGLGLADTAMSFLGSYGSVGTPVLVARQAWDLDGVSARYQDFIAAFAGAAPATGADFLVAQTRLVHAWRRFPFLDPQLPADLLPSGWAGTTAAQLFESRHEAWQREAQRHWETLVAESRPLARPAAPAPARKQRPPASSAPKTAPPSTAPAATPPCSTCMSATRHAA